MVSLIQLTTMLKVYFALENLKKENWIRKRIESIDQKWLNLLNKGEAMTFSIWESCCANSNWRWDCFSSLSTSKRMTFYFFFVSETPLSLQSVCRLVIQKALGIFNLDKIDQLGLVPPFDQLESFFQNVKLNSTFET